MSSAVLVLDLSQTVFSLSLLLSASFCFCFCAVPFLLLQRCTPRPLRTHINKVSSHCKLALRIVWLHAANETTAVQTQCHPASQSLIAISQIHTRPLCHSLACCPSTTTQLTRSHSLTLICYRDYSNSNKRNNNHSPKSRVRRRRTELRAASQQSASQFSRDVTRSAAGGDVRARDSGRACQVAER